MMTEIKVNFTEVRLAYNSIEARLKELGANKMDSTNFLNQVVYTKLKEEFGINLWDRKAKYGIESDRLYFFFNTLYELQIFKKLCREKLDEVEETGIMDFKKEVAIDSSNDSKGKNTNNSKTKKTNDNTNVVKSSKFNKSKETETTTNQTSETTTKDKTETTTIKSTDNITTKDDTIQNQKKFDISNQTETCRFIKYLNKINCIFTSLEDADQRKFEKELYKNLVKKSNSKCNPYSRVAQDIDMILEHFNNLNDFILNLASRLTIEDNEYIVEAVKLTKENLKIAA